VWLSIIFQWLPPLPDDEKKQLGSLDKKEDETEKPKKDKTKGKSKKEKEQNKKRQKQVLAYPRQMVFAISSSGTIFLQLPYSEVCVWIKHLSITNIMWKTVITSFPIVALRSYSLLEDNMWFALQMKEDYEDVAHLSDAKRVIVFNGVEVFYLIAFVPHLVNILTTCRLKLLQRR